MKRFTIQFYGGWFVIDNNGRASGGIVYNETLSTETRDQALRLAERHNKSGDRLPVLAKTA